MSGLAKSGEFGKILGLNQSSSW